MTVRLLVATLIVAEAHMHGLVRINDEMGRKFKGFCVFLQR